MTDPIGTAQERELIETLEKAAAYVADHVGLMLEADQYAALASDLRRAADALQSRIAEVGRLEAALGNTLDLIDELYRRHGVELEPDEVAVAQNARDALSLQRRV